MHSKLHRLGFSSVDQLLNRGLRFIGQTELLGHRRIIDQRQFAHKRGIRSLDRIAAVACHAKRRDYHGSAPGNSAPIERAIQRVSNRKIHLGIPFKTQIRSRGDWPSTIVHRRRASVTLNASYDKTPSGERSFERLAECQRRELDERPHVLRLTRSLGLTAQVSLTLRVTTLLIGLAVLIGLLLPVGALLLCTRLLRRRLLLLLLNERAGNGLSDVRIHTSSKLHHLDHIHGWLGRIVERRNHPRHVVHQVLPLGRNDQRVAQLVDADREFAFEFHLGGSRVFVPAVPKVRDVHSIGLVPFLLLLVALQRFVIGAQQIAVNVLYRLANDLGFGVLQSKDGGHPCGANP